MVYTNLLMVSLYLLSGNQILVYEKIIWIILSSTQDPALSYTDIWDLTLTLC